MSDYALHDGNVVSNVIVAQSQAAADYVAGALTALETDGVPWIGWTLHGDEWRPPMPDGGAWEWDDDAGEWVDVTLEPEPEPDAE